MNATTTSQERTAYRCQVVANELSAAFAPRVRTECATVDDALQRLERGDTVIVAGSDMAALRTRLARLGVG
jgi:hypothetical protein